MHNISKANYWSLQENNQYLFQYFTWHSTKVKLDDNIFQSCGLFADIEKGGVYLCCKTNMNRKLDREGMVTLILREPLLLQCLSIKLPICEYQVILLFVD